MREVSLAVHQRLVIDNEFEIEIIEIRDDSVIISIRSESVSPYYWEQELACEESRCLTEMMSL
jgi:hypothetical protein